MEQLIYVLAVGLISGVAYLLKKREADKRARFLAEGAPEPAFEMPSMRELRTDPDVLESLRGKVVSICYNSRAEIQRHGRNEIDVGESFLVDINGAIQTIERGTSVRIEENARWLAEQLDVEYVQ